MSDRIRVEQSLQVKGEFIVTGLATVQNNLSLNNTRIINLADPVDPNDAATRVYVDNLASGLDFHEPAKLATTTDLDNIGNGTWVQAGAGPTATLTAGSVGTSVIDGVVLLNGDRILVKNQVDTSQNGIYIVSGAGSTFVTTLSRVLDQNEPNEFPGSFVFVEQGTVNGSTGWVILTPPDTVDTDPVVWIQFSGAAQLTGGDGITISGTVVAVNLVPDTGLNISSGGRLQISSSFAGTGLTRTAGVLNVNANQSQITQIGTITSGTWNATPITLAFGGTGGTTASTARTNLGITSLATQQPNNVTITGGTISNVLFSPPIAITSGGTGANNAADARDNLVVVHRAGDTMTGDLTVGDGTGVPTIGINGAIASKRSLAYFSGGVLRWEIVTSDEPEAVAGPTDFTKLSDPAALPTGQSNSVKFSPDSVHMTVAHFNTPFITIYERSGNTFTKVANPATLPTNTGRSVDFSNDGTLMAVAHFGIPRITIYERSGNTFTKVADPDVIPPFNAWGAAFSPDDVHLAVAHDSSPFVTIYERSGTTFTKLANPATLPTSDARSVAFSRDGTHLAVGHTLSPFITIYERSGNTFTKVADPATLPPATSFGVAFSNDGVHLAVSHTNSPNITIYERSGNTFTKLANPAVLPTGGGNGVAFSPDDAFMTVAHSTSPFVTIYERSGNTFTKVADPTVLPTNAGIGVTFSPDGIHMPIAHASSPFVTIYEVPGVASTNEGSNFAIRRYDDSGVLLSESLRINRTTGRVTFGNGLELTGALVLGTPLAVTEGGTGASTAAGARTNLGLGTISTQDASNVVITGGSITGITDLAIADGGTGASTAADARTNLGLGTISTQDASNVVITGGSITGITPLAVSDGGTGANNATDARTNLGLGTISTQNANNVSITGGSISGATISGIPALAIADGGTGATTAAGARTNLGLGTISTQDASNVSITGGSLTGVTITGITPIAIADGGTGATTASGARANLGAVNIAGDTMTGDLVVGSGSGASNITVDGASGFIRALNFNTTGSPRWSIITGSTAETGSNAGSDFIITRNSDAGAFINAPIVISRFDGDIVLDGNVTITGNTTFTTQFELDSPLPITSGGTGADTAAGARTNLVVVHRAGDTMTGNLTVGDGSAASTIGIDGVNATDRSLAYFTGGILRWDATADSSLESGSDAGSNFALRRYNDGGTLLGSVVTISRSTGNITITNNTDIQGALTLSTTPLAITSGGTGATTAAGARTNLGLAIGTDVQAWDMNLDQIAALTPDDSNFIVGNGAGWITESGSVARTSLGLGTIATQDASNVLITGGSITGITDLAIADGGTGASTAADARTNLGLVIGTDVQAWDINLDQIAALTPTDSNFIVGNGTAWVAESGDVARTSLGLGTGDTPTFFGLSAGSQLITNVATPVVGTDAANKNYVDSATVGLASWQIITTAHNAVDGDRLLVDTSGGTVTVTLPATPSLGDEVHFADKAGTFATNNLIIARNGQNILGLAEDLNVDINNEPVALVFSDATHGWRLAP